MNTKPRYFDEMLVVCEKKNLRLAGKVAQDPKACGGTAVIVIDEQVVGDEGQSCSVVGAPLVRSLLI